MPHDCEPIIGPIEALDRLARRGPQRPTPMASPGCDVHESVSAPGPQRAEPDGGHPAQAETVPGAVGGNMVVSQGGETHLLPLLQEERHIVNALRDDGRDLGHAQSLAPSGIYLQI